MSSQYSKTNSSRRPMYLPFKDTNTGDKIGNGMAFNTICDTTINKEEYAHMTTNLEFDTKNPMPEEILIQNQILAISGESKLYAEKEPQPDVQWKGSYYKVPPLKIEKTFGYTQ